MSGSSLFYESTRISPASRVRSVGQTGHLVMSGNMALKVQSHIYLFIVCLGIQSVDGK